VVTGAHASDTDNDGRMDAVSVDTANVATGLLREAYVGWHDADDRLRLHMGRMRIPFTSQASTRDTDLMFPGRSGPNEVFLQGTDLGGQGSLYLGDGKFKMRMGIFNGTGHGVADNSQRSVLYAARVDLEPLGDVSHSETRLNRGPVRFGLGAGLLWHPYNSFDAAGEPAMAFTDTRGSLSFVLSGLGMHLQVEALGRVQEDSLTARPLWATGAYAQIGALVRDRIEPVARVGGVRTDMSFDPRDTIWTDVGLNAYPHLPDEGKVPVRLGLHYLGEHRLTEAEVAHGLSFQAQVQW
jgi:hypothetical protein